MPRQAIRLARYQGHRRFRNGDGHGILIQGAVNDGPRSEIGKTVQIPIRNAQQARLLADSLLKFAEEWEATPDQVPYRVPDSRGNWHRVEGVDRCVCGCKYWVHDHCIDCGGTQVQPAE